MSAPVYKVGDPAPPPLPRRSEAEVMARWQGDKPVVSIRCATYQHVDFIEDALRGFLGQDTDFPFEILVRDDASTDGTAEIVRDYAERYPNIIRAVLETENRYPEVKAAQVLGPMARGEFIAMCEGDDYWIDEGHLTRSVAVLRENSAVAVAASASLMVHDGVINSLRPFFRQIRGRVVRAADLNRIDRDDEAKYAKARAPWGDVFLRHALAAAGETKRIPIVVAVKREHSGGIARGLILAGRRQEHRVDGALSHFWAGQYLLATGNESQAAIAFRMAEQRFRKAIPSESGLKQQDFAYGKIHGYKQGFREGKRVAKRTRAYRLGSVILGPARLVKTIFRKS